MAQNSNENLGTDPLEGEDAAIYAEAKMRALEILGHVDTRAARMYALSNLREHLREILPTEKQENQQQ